MTKKISLFLVLVLSVLTFGMLGSRHSVEAVVQKDESVTVTLHKLLFDFDKMPEEILNDGHINPAYGDYETLNGAEFEVYDVTEELLGHLANGLTTEEAQMELANLELSSRTPLETKVTAGEGTAEFSLPVSEGNTAYLFHESNLPAGIRERAANMVLILSYADANGIPMRAIHLYPKNESERISVEKEVMDDISYEIGEPIPYEIRTRVPQNPQDYEVFRIMDVADPVLLFDAESLTVTIGGTQVDDVYDLEANANGFALNFDLALLEVFSHQEIVVNYEMSLSEAAIPDVDYFNEVTVEYDNHVSIDQNLVRTGGYRFVKVDLRDEETTLAGAHFVVRNQENDYLVIGNGQYIWDSNRDNATVWISDAEGSFEIIGLRYGQYALEEIRAPEGYVLSNTAIPFNVRNGTYNPRAIMNIVNQPIRPTLPDTGGEPTPSEPVTPERPRLPVTRGEERPRLPRTGEMNPFILSVVGILFILGALIILLSERNKRRNNK